MFATLVNRVSKLQAIKKIRKTTAVLLLGFTTSWLSTGCAQARLADWDDDDMENTTGQGDYRATSSGDPNQKQEVISLCYKLLGLKNDARPKDIEKAFKKLARQYHPDKNPDNENMANTIIAALNRAKEILDNPKQILSDYQKRDNTNTPEEHDIKTLQEGLDAKKRWRRSGMSKRTATEEKM